MKRRRLATRLSHLLAGDPSHPWPLMEQAHRLMQLERRVVALLDPELGRHCRVAAMRGDCLFLRASSPAWATRLRYAAPAIVEQLSRSSEFSRLRKVQVRVLVEDPGKRPVAAPRPHLSRASAELIEETALGLARGDLRDSLLRLARRAGKS